MKVLSTEEGRAARPSTLKEVRRSLDKSTMGSDICRESFLCKLSAPVIIFRSPEGFEVFNNNMSREI